MTELMRYSEDDRVRLVAAEKIGERGLGKAREFVPDEDASTRHPIGSAFPTRAHEDC